MLKFIKLCSYINTYGIVVILPIQLFAITTKPEQDQLLENKIVKF